MKILYINHYAGSPEFGMEFRPYYLGSLWQQQGHDVLVVASSFSHLRRKNPQVILFRKFLVNNIPYLFFKTNSYVGNGVSRVLNIFLFVGWLLLAIPYFVIWRPDVVVASSTYPLDVFPAWVLSKIVRAKVIHEVHDLWPLTLTEIGGMSRKHPFVRLLQSAEDFSYGKVDRVVSMLQAALPYMQEHGLSKDRFCFVPNGVMLKDWQNPVPLADEINAAIRYERSKGHFIVGYAGSMGISNSLETLISAFEFLRDAPISLILLGHGPDAEMLKVKAQAVSENIKFFPPVDKAQIPSFLNGVDANFIGAPRSSLYRFGVSPNKLLDYLMAGRPIINAIEAGNNWVEDSQSGYTVPPEDSRALADALSKLSQVSKAERDLMGKRGREMALRDFEYGNLASKFVDGL